MHFLMDLLLEDPRPPLKTGAHEPEASNSWSSLSPTGTLPTARYYHTAVWGISSSGKHGFYIFGGDDGSHGLGSFRGAMQKHRVGSGGRANRSPRLCERFTFLQPGRMREQAFD